MAVKVRVKVEKFHYLLFTFMRLSPSVIQLLSAKSGLKLNDTSHCAQLVRSIEESTHEHLGVNTMKRLLGFIPDERSPSSLHSECIGTLSGFRILATTRGNGG